MRILILGGPKTGKTTLANKIGERMKLAISPPRIRHSDELIGKLDWSDSSKAVALWLSEPGNYVIEGVTVIRALRKHFAISNAGPCDHIIYLTEPYVTLTPGQLSMTKGVDTIWGEIRPEIIKRNIPISGCNFI
jgi:hypothetical protein